MKPLASGCVTLFASVLLAATPPSTDKRPVTDDYHGVKVTDDYRWLENWSDSAVQAWSAAQNTYARAYLDALPLRKTVAAQLERIYTQRSRRFSALSYCGGHLFAMVETPPKEQPALDEISVDDPASARVIVDPPQIDP